jgi:hypothetical protein
MVSELDERTVILNKLSAVKLRWGNGRKKQKLMKR